MDFPTVSWIKQALRNNPIYSTRRSILAAYIVGSYAKGTSTDHSDLDVALIVDPVKGKTSVQLTEAYHNHFASDTFRPKWMGKIVDIQFFYTDDLELCTYSKITLQ